jgi:DNA polymerase-3 subunit alpha
LSGVGKLADNAMIACVCLIAQIRPLVAKRGKSAGKKMAGLTLEDLSGRCEAVMFPEAFEKFGRSLEADTIQYVTGTVSMRNERVNIIVEELCPVPAAVERFTESLALRLPGNGIAEGMLGKLRGLLERHAGNCTVAIQVQSTGDPQTFVLIGTARQWCVKPSTALLDELGKIVGTANVVVRPKKPARKADNGRTRWKRTAGTE